MASKRIGSGTGPAGHTYAHTTLDDHSRPAYTDALDDEEAVNAAEWWLWDVSFMAAQPRWGGPGLQAVPAHDRPCLSPNAQSIPSQPAIGSAG